MSFENISLGDIAAVAALISSPLIFIFGYRRTRRSEQIKTARELTDRIFIKTEEIKDLDRTRPGLPEQGDFFEQHENEKPKIDWIKKYRRLLFQILDEAEYFSYLVTKHEIGDKNTIDYYAPKMYGTLRSVESKFRFLEREEKDLKTLRHTYGDPRLGKLILLWKDRVKDHTSIEL